MKFYLKAWYNHRKYSFTNKCKGRLAKAAELLPGAKSVGEVCEMCGFADCSDFIGIFRQQIGITSLKYKKLYGTRKSSDTEA